MFSNKVFFLNSYPFRVGLITFFCLLILTIIQCTHAPKANVIPEVVVGFELNNSSGSETVANTNLVINLSANSSQAVTVDYAINGGTASVTTAGSGRDYFLKSGTLIFEPGMTTQSIPITILNDVINETDETIEVSLSNPSHAVLGANRQHTYTIVDDDRQIVVDVVKDFGAVGDGITDDTKAIQQAINTTYEAGGGVILFPAGIYVVTSVDLKENITYQGYEATIKRPPNQDKWTRTFTTQALYRENLDGKPIIIKGLEFDGNSQNQGSYKDYELEQAHLIYLTGNPNSPTRLQAFVEDCTFRNAVADAISIYVNVDIKVFNCEAIDVFRGGFVLTGGYSSAEVYNLTTRGQEDATGIDIEVDGEGYKDTYTVDVILINLNLINGDFDVDVRDGSTVIGNNIISSDAPFRLFSLKSSMKFTNSKFKVGAADGYTNLILLPHNVTFENCEFIATRKMTDEPHDFFGLDVWWQHPYYGTQKNQSLIFKNCQFEIDKNLESTDRIHALYLRSDDPKNGNILKIDGGSVSSDFKIGIFRETVSD
jgi:hypothetical protein